MTKPCPMCGKPADLTRENRSRPFCSERCQLLDLGNWLDGVYAVPGEPAELPDAPDSSGQRTGSNE